MFRFLMLLRLPRGLRRYFDANGSSTWVLLRHGLKAWPVEIVNHEFREVWESFRAAHDLHVDYKLILACEHKWIFLTIMFDRDGQELVFAWSGPNAHYQDLHPPSGNLCIASLPSEFELGLNKPLGLEQMVIRMANRTWTIPIENLYLNVEAFNQFVDAPNLQFLDYLMVLVLHTVIFEVVIFHGHNDSERIYNWF
ncbi:hypothetical protein RHSIM_Rhsim01G0171000 [Rhododendron simsii]|uniref:Uncharacterized protein n=1 Tax=Rhododendron simsii TaxID=118357 RepID=A0A834LXM2_RHOSS|nr:hypothetical protein RHSIM_Rhsim01G0171000 [Rhododendron simsii]